MKMKAEIEEFDCVVPIIPRLHSRARLAGLKQARRTTFTLCGGESLEMVCVGDLLIVGDDFTESRRLIFRTRIHRI